MNNKHTPGPWKHREYVSPKGSFFVRGPKDETIVTGPALVNEADARLIAAAPELKSTGEELSDAATEYATLLQVANFNRNDIAVHRAYERLRKAIEANRAAIDKAVG